MPPTSIPKIFLAGGAVGFGYYLVMRQHWFPNPYKTQGTQNIEDRFSAAGGSPTHTPASGTKMGGDSNDHSTRQSTPSGPTSKEFKDTQNDQYTEQGVWPKKFYEAQYQNPKGK
ncbi:hypothetical protein BDV96DRAFT_180083 [Lophiotrema nucula]|uniref:Uncharacterized protein n=1 Tax=Lophiotrema nucula TaxID=690887 RepID=A0A6A5YYX7_9PLEO|nr:hypothetical protein BDV96DRAFT_180083 [Lophiotrema nucula]